MKNHVDYSKIKGFILDVDGVLTDGSILAMEDGSQIRIMNIKDGYALQLAVKCGYSVCIISGGSSQGVRVRLQGLGIQHIYMGAGEKLPVFMEFLQSTGLKAEELIYIGDDMPDIPVMQQVGISIAPADAAADVLKIADVITDRPGGKGCVREVLESVLKVQGHWLHTDSFVW